MKTVHCLHTLGWPCAGFGFVSVSTSRWMLFDMRPALLETLAHSQWRPCQRDVCSFFWSTVGINGKASGYNAMPSAIGMFFLSHAWPLPPHVSLAFSGGGQGSVLRCEKCRMKMVNENASVLLGRALHCNNSVKLTLSKTSLGKVSNPQQIHSLDQSITALLDCCTWISNVLAV